MAKTKKPWQSKAADLGHLRTEMAKEEFAKMRGNDYEVISKGYPDITAFNAKTGTFYFIEVKSEKEMGKPLRPEQEKIKKILERITKKPNFEVWYFSDDKSKKNKILVKCLYIGKKLIPYDPGPEKLSPEIAEKFQT